MLDWDDLRFFLAIARHRTLSAAAKHLGVTQSTVGRRLAALQDGMGVRLLQRAADGYAPTLAGDVVRPYVEGIEAAALSLEGAVSGRDVRLEGVVRVTSSQMVASHLLAPCFAVLHDRHPTITIEALPNLPANALSARDADVSVQLTPFEHHELVVRTIGRMGFGLYGSLPYLGRYGEPDLATGCAGHRLITALDDQPPSSQAAWLAEHAGRARVVMRCDSYEVQHWAVLCGGAVALLPRFRGDAEPTLRRVGTGVSIPGAEITLAVHRENRQTPRIRTVLDCISDAVRSRAASLDPQEPAPEAVLSG
jgi:DNA-binding transcriptional LysR family regulator